MRELLNKFIKKDPKKSIEVIDNSNSIKDESNWYKDRFGILLMQRNLLFFVSIIFLSIVAISVFFIGDISTNKSLKPFVIEIEDQTGVTSIVNPTDVNVLSGNQSLNQYFIMKYINARENYDEDNYKYNYLTVVRLLSSQEVFNNFRNFINSNPASPIQLYGSYKTTNILMKSILFMKSDPSNTSKKVTVRFTIYDSTQTTILKHRIATLTFDYLQTRMTDDERLVNPIGFTVLDYISDDENL